MDIQDNKYIVFCDTNDFYIGDTIIRKLVQEGKQNRFYYRELPNCNEVATGDTFVGIINPEVMKNQEFLELITLITIDNKKKTILIENEIVEDVPDNWGEIRYIEAYKGLDNNILETILGVSKNPTGILRNIKKEIETQQKALEEKLERERLELIERENQAQLEAQKLEEENRKIFLRKYGPTTLEELIIREPNASANVIKGIKYLIGEDLPQDGIRAFSILLEEAKEHPDDINALYHLGICYDLGYGNLSKEDNLDKMIEIFSKTMKAGYENAYVLLSLALMTKTGEVSEAEKIIQDLSKINKAASLYYAGLIDELCGRYQDALEKYYGAAEEGYAPAQNALGYMYGEGWATEQNIIKASQWFELAAKQDFTQAIFNLGYTMYYFSDEDNVRSEGLQKMRIVAQSGDERAIQIVDAIDSQILNQQREEEKIRRKQELTNEILETTLNITKTMGLEFLDVIKYISRGH